MGVNGPNPERDEDNRSAEDGSPASGGMEPADLVKAVGSMLLTAIAILVVVWVLVFAVTRGDALGITIVIVTIAVLLGYAWLRRRFG